MHTLPSQYVWHAGHGRGDPIATDGSGVKRRCGPSRRTSHPPQVCHASAAKPPQGLGQRFSRPVWVATTRQRNLGLPWSIVHTTSLFRISPSPAVYHWQAPDRHFAAKQPDDLTVWLQLGRPRMTFFTDCAASFIMHRVSGFETAIMSRRDRLRRLVQDKLWPTAREGSHATGPVHSGISDQVVICLSTTLVRADDATFLWFRHCRRWRCANV